MSGPARKKTGEPPAVWAGEHSEALQQMIKRIRDKLPEFAANDAAMALAERILRAYLHNREQPAAGADHRAVMKRREGMINAGHDLMQKMARVIEDGAPASVSTAFDALAVALVETMQDTPEGYTESEADARDRAVVALMALAEAHGIEPQKIAFYSGLIEYQNDEQFQRAVNRAVQKYSGQN